MDAKIIEILDKNNKYCSHGDTVNYADPPKVFEDCDGSFLFDGIKHLILIGKCGIQQSILDIKTSA